jgi:thioredoxin reductase (NADPH)
MSVQLDSPESAMPQTVRTKVLILGSGPAGYTAAIYAARANLKPVLLRGLQPGGQLSITTEVENYPGFAEAIQGPWLMEQMAKQAEHVGTQIIEDTIVKVDLGRRPFVCTGDGGDLYIGETLIICTGAQARWLNLPSETKFRGYGVSACATCDGFFFRNKRVAVVGGGNTAVEEALYLTNHASHVTLIHRRDTLRADKTNQARLFANPKITMAWNSVVEDVLGEDNPPTVSGLKLRNVVSGAHSTLNIDGLFVAIGHDPATALFKGQLDIDAEGYILTRPDSTATSVPGVFAAGDIRAGAMNRVASAVGEGSMVVRFVHEYLALT